MEDQGDERESLAAIPTAVSHESTPIPAVSATEAHSVSSTGTQEQDTEYAKDVAPVSDVPWQEQFTRIEQAWLVDQSVGDPHEMGHFRAIAARVCRIQPDLRDDANSAIGSFTSVGNEADWIFTPKTPT
jgi:hypothetical protein